jgi:hypothetical protein
MLIALPVGQLHEAQAVAPWDETHGFGVDRDRAVREAHVPGQIFLVKMDRHSISSRNPVQSL